MALASTSKVQHVLILPRSGSSMAIFRDCADPSDCVVVTERDGKSRSCHKVVLSAASAVFRAMFVSSNMREASSGRVVIKEADPQVVELLLRHMYGLEVQVPVQQAAALYQLADQYQVQALLQQLVTAVSDQPFQLGTLALLMAKAAALGDAALQLRIQLAQKAVEQVSDFLVKQPEYVKQWGLLEVQLVMQSSAVTAGQGLLLAAIWVAGGAERKQYWSGLQPRRCSWRASRTSS